MKKAIVLMLVLVLALSLIIFTACDDDKDSGKGSSTGVVFNENMSLEDALAAVQADSEFKGFSVVYEYYNQDGSLKGSYPIEGHYNDSFAYWIATGEGSIFIMDFNEHKSYSLWIDDNGEMEEVYYSAIKDEDIADMKDEIIDYRDSFIKDFFYKKDNAKYTATIEGTSLILVSGNEKTIYSKFNAGYSLPEKYSNYKANAQLEVDAD